MSLNVTKLDSSHDKRRYFGYMYSMTIPINRAIAGGIYDEFHRVLESLITIYGTYQAIIQTIPNKLCRPYSYEDQSEEWLVANDKYKAVLRDCAGMGRKRREECERGQRPKTYYQTIYLRSEEQLLMLRLSNDIEMAGE